jgi:hypothetical protein
VLAVTLTEKGRALRTDAEKIPPAVVAKLGMELEELMALHPSLTRVIAASQAALDSQLPSRRGRSLGRHGSRTFGRSDG